MQQCLSFILLSIFFFHPINAFINSKKFNLILLTELRVDVSLSKYQVVSFILSCIYLTVADVDCGVTKFRTGKIVNGIDAAEGEFPW